MDIIILFFILFLMHAVMFILNVFVNACVYSDLYCMCTANFGTATFNGVDVLE